MFERVADTGQDFVRGRPFASLGSGKRGFGIAGVLLALGTELFDQRLPILFKILIART